jgi:hypothetical protein
MQYAENARASAVPHKRIKIQAHQVRENKIIKIVNK